MTANPTNLPPPSTTKTEGPDDPPAPLTGIRLVEIGNLIAAPYAGMLLADLGAEVIKVEPPSGDLSRNIGPFQNQESLFFMAVNRGKQSLVVDTKNPDHRHLLTELVGSSDVLLSNLRSGAMTRMGLGFEQVAMRFPQVVYAVVSAFGSDGPYADRAGVDLIFQAESGMLSITGHQHDPIQKTATTVADYTAATNIALCICAALVERSRTGKGRLVEVSLRDGLFAIQAGWFALAFASGRQPDRTGTSSPFLAPNRVFAASDGFFSLAIVSDHHFRRLAEVLDHPQMVERFPTNADRVRNRDKLLSWLQPHFVQKPTEYWLEVLSRAGLPVGKVRDLLEAISDPAAKANQMRVRYSHPVAGEIETVGSPLRFDHQPVRTNIPPPQLGQHSDQIWERLSRGGEQV